MKKIEICLITVLLIVAAINTYVLIDSKNDTKIIERRTHEIIKESYYTRSEVNAFIDVAFQKGQAGDIQRFYADVVGSVSVADSLLHSSRLRGIPVHIAFALAFVESGFNVDTKIKNRDGTVDLGLMGLNSKTFEKKIREYGIDWIVERKNNIRLGLDYLLYQYAKNGENWDRAVIKYNGRFEAGADEHLLRVLAKERELDKMFNGNNWK